MSAAALAWALPVAVTGAKKAVLLALAAGADDDGRVTTRQSLLAVHAGVTDRAVRAALTELAAVGLLARDGRGCVLALGKAEAGSGLAVPRPQKAERGSGSKSAETERGSGLGQQAERGSGSEAVEAERRSGLAGKAERGSGKAEAGSGLSDVGLPSPPPAPLSALPLPPAPPLSIPPITPTPAPTIPARAAVAATADLFSDVAANTPPLPSPNGRGGRRGNGHARADAEPPEFLAFWAAYPRKREGAGACREAWHRAAAKAPAAEIMAGLARYAFSDDPKFIPMARTWLNQERWRGAADTAAATVEADARASRLAGADVILGQQPGSLLAVLQARRPAARAPPGAGEAPIIDLDAGEFRDH